MTTNRKISQLTSASPITGNELVPVVQNGETRQATVLDLAIAAGLSLAQKADRIGDFLDDVQYIGFNTSVSNGLATGRLAWNSNDGTLDVGLPGDTVLQLGQETLFYVKNTGGTVILNGQFVMATGAVGASGKITAGLAVADGTVSPEFFLGVATQDIPNQEFGYVTHFGLVRGINTTGSTYSEAWADGDLLYANPSVVGGLTKQAPSFPGFSTPLAIVINAAAGGAGSIFVRMKSGEYLFELHDVNITTPVSGDILAYVSSTGAWTNSDALIQVQASVSDLVINVAAVSAQAAATQTQVNAVSVLTSINTAAITSINAMVTLAARTLTSATFNDGYTEEVVTISGTTPVLSPTNGTLQLWTLTGSSTPTAGTWGSGQPLTLMIDDGSVNTVNWASVAPVWKTNAGVAPTLNLTGYTVIQFWKAESTIYGARVGDA